MDRMLVVIFDTEDKGIEGSHALRKLDDDGLIAIYDAAIVKKSPNGTTTARRIGEFGPAGTMAGLAVGSLIGLLGGPAGVAVGFAGGTLLGALVDFENVRVGTEFIADVEKELLPGKAALVAEIDEEQTASVDEAMEPLGGHVLRRSLWELRHQENKRDIATTKAEIAQSKAEHAVAKAERKTKLEARIEALNARLKQKIDQAKAGREAVRHQAQAKIDTLKAKAAQSGQAIKAKHELRVAKAKKEYQKCLDEGKNA